MIPKHVLVAFRNHYVATGKAAWGDLHIVMDDGNMEDGFILYCLKTGVAKDDLDVVRACGFLLSVPFAQRKDARGMIDNLVGHVHECRAQREETFGPSEDFFRAWEEDPSGPRDDD